MSDFVSVVAVDVVEVAPKGSDDKRVFKKGDKPFMISAQDFAELGPDGLRAVRRPTKAERNPLDHDNNGTIGGAVALTPKHKGGGKWVVVDASDSLVTGDELFDDKDAAQAWIDAGGFKGL